MLRLPAGLRHGTAQAWRPLQAAAEQSLNVKETRAQGDSVYWKMEYLNYPDYEQICR